MDSLTPYALKGRSLSKLLGNDAARISPWQNIQSGIDTRSGRLIMRDSTTQRIFIGVDPTTGTPVGKMSEAGYDAETTTQEHLVWSTALRSFEIVTAANVTLPAATIADGGVGVWASSSSTVNVTHTLGYRPVVFAFAGNPDPGFAIPETVSTAPAADKFYMFSLLVSPTTVGVDFSLYVTGLHYGITLGPYNVSYFITRQPIA
jgi:hypothetical protein